MDNDTLIKLASMFCPKCFNPTKMENANFRFRLYCQGLKCISTHWRNTETEAREAWIKKSVEFLGLKGE